MLTIGSLFSGIGGLELGLEKAGLGPVLWQVERDAFCRRVLAKHWPDTERFDDVRAVGASVLRRVDLICGGFPCQDISAAGRGRGLAGARSGLWAQFARLVGEIGPRFVVVENVPMLRRRGLGTVLSDLSARGYDATWDCIPAAAIGAHHRRDRLFMVAWRVPDANGEPVRVRTERNEAERRDLRDEGKSVTGYVGAKGDELADAYHQRRKFVEAAWLHAFGAPRHDAIGCHRFPPPPNKARAWEAWSASGGPEPGIRRGSDGISARLDRNARLKALGNAVVPQVAEAIGRVVLAALSSGGDA